MLNDEYTNDWLNQQGIERSIRIGAERNVGHARLPYGYPKYRNANYMA